MNKEKQDEFVAWLEKKISIANSLMDGCGYSDAMQYEAVIDSLTEAKSQFLSLTMEQDNEQ